VAAPLFASPSSPPPSSASPGIGGSGDTLGSGAPLSILSASPRWDGHVPRGPVTICYAVAGLIGEAEIEVDDYSEPDCYPNCSGMAVSGAPEEWHDELREIAEAVFLTVDEVGRSGLEAINRARAISFDLRNRKAA
jgi:hypothetical protein